MVKKSARPSRKPVFLILGLSLILAIGFAIYKTYLAPTPVAIMAIDPVPVTYGQTTLTGIIQKDSPVGVDGSFILTLPDLRVVQLNVNGLDHLIGLKATISGNLSPALENYIPMTMQVNSITIAQE